MEFKSEVFDRFSALFKKRKGNKLKKAELLKEQEDLLQEIEIQREIIQHLKEALTKAKDEVEGEKCYLEGVLRGRFLASREELGLLEEFRILEQIKETLMKGVLNEDFQVKKRLMRH
ncbi:uncharacterized protein [Rhodnius prolixus]|uniref:Uncharacterized protein n=1 Tax=Rhodnius prolixus TaxID=13249 RepID=T1IFX8_RHOPR